MNEQTEKLINEALAGAINAVKTTGNFVVEQAPDVIRQLLLFNAIETGIWMGVQWLLALAILILVWKLNKKYPQWCYEEHSWGKELSPYVPVIAFPALGYVVLVSAAIKSTIELLKIVYTPKLWLLEYAAALIK